MCYHIWMFTSVQSRRKINYIILYMKYIGISCWSVLHLFCGLFTENYYYIADSFITHNNMCLSDIFYFVKWHNKSFCLQKHKSLYSYMIHAYKDTSIPFFIRRHDFTNSNILMWLKDLMAFWKLHLLNIFVVRMVGTQIRYQAILPSPWATWPEHLNINTDFQNFVLMCLITLLNTSWPSYLYEDPIKK